MAVLCVMASVFHVVCMMLSNDQTNDLQTMWFTSCEFAEGHLLHDRICTIIIGHFYMVFDEKCGSMWDFMHNY